MKKSKSCKHLKLACSLIVLLLYVMSFWSLLLMENPMSKPVVISKFQNEYNSFQHHQSIVYDDSEKSKLEFEMKVDVNVTNHHPKEKPIFVMFVGPPKMASSSIQCNILKYVNELKQDGYIYVGKIPAPCSPNYPEPIQFDESFKMNIIQCLRKSDCDKNMLSMAFQHYKDLNQNIFLIDELLIYYGSKGIQWDDLKLLLKGWDVHVVIGYRRYFEWAMSSYNQFYRPTKFKKLSLVWPTKGGKSIIHPKKFIMNNGRFQSPYPFTLDVPFYDHFNTTLFNMQEDDKDPVELFMCNVLFNAFKTCNALRADLMAHTKVKYNKALSPNYDLLATTAYELDILSNMNLTRRLVGRATRYYQEHILGLSSKDFRYLECIDDSRLELLLEYSIQIEAKVYSLFKQTKPDEYIHRAAFRKSKDDNSFCLVDHRRLLSMDLIWRSFFQTLGDGSTNDTLTSESFQSFVNSLREN